MGKQTVVHISIMEYYSAIKRTTDKYNNMNNLKCKFSVKEARLKRLYIVWFHLCDMAEKANHRDGVQIPGCQGLRVGTVWTNQVERGNYIQGDDGTVLIVVMVVPQTLSMCQNLWNYRPKSINFIVCKLIYKI